MYIKHHTELHPLVFRAICRFFISNKYNHAYKSCLPQILRGASSSRRMGWLRKISLDLRHNPRISFSCSCTFLPGFAPLTATRKQKRKLSKNNNGCTQPGWQCLLQHHYAEAVKYKMWPFTPRQNYAHSEWEMQCVSDQVHVVPCPSSITQKYPQPTHKLP